MNQELDQARDQFIQGMSRITHFWGFPKAMGAMYGAIYLSPDPLSLDQIVTQVGVSKGAELTHGNIISDVTQVKYWIHKAIKEGEEITGDYSEDLLPGEELECNCGSRKCRGVIRKKR